MGFLDGLIDAGIAAANYGLERESQQYQRYAQQETWKREDSAVQRRVADLQAAGLSPVLAAGSAASTSSPIQTGAPQIDFSAMDRARLAADMAVQKKNIDRTDAEISAINAKAVPDKLMAKVIEKASQYVTEDGSPIINKLARNWLEAQDAATDNAKAAAKERSIQAALLNRMYSFDVEKGVYNSEMRNMAANTEFFRNMFNSGDKGDWLGAVLQLIGKINK